MSSFRNPNAGFRVAFVVDSRAPGPNAFLDGDSINEFATSELTTGRVFNSTHNLA